MQQLVSVTNLPCPPSNAADDRSIATLKRHACDFVHQQMTHDDGQISYLEVAEEHDYDTLALAQMLAK
jgi:hypothetical protein